LIESKPNIPRTHPIIALVAVEWKRAAATKTSPNFDAFSLAKVAKLCKERAARHPDWIAKLTKVDLSHLLRSQRTDRWWLPGVKTADDIADEEDEEEGEEEGEEDEEEVLPGV
jgi:hypothetical protein